MTQITIKKGIEKITNDMFPIQNRRLVTEICIPEGLKSIGNQCFQSYHQLKRIYLPESLVEIHPHAFYDCAQLIEISLPYNLKFIGQGCFMYCTNLKNIRIPNSVNYVGERCFNGCYRLSHIEWSRNCPIVLSSTFAFCRNLKSIEFPDGITNIKTYTFNSCTSLERCTFPNTIKTIEHGTFRFCKGDILIKFKNITNREYINQFPNILEFNREATYKNVLENIGTFITNIKLTNNILSEEVIDVKGIVGSLVFATLDGNEYHIKNVNNQNFKNLLCQKYKYLNKEKDNWDIFIDEENINECNMLYLVNMHFSKKFNILEPILIYWNKMT